jgi:hypothetical protein
MINLLNNPARLYTPEKAEALAAEMQAGDDSGWTFKAKHSPTGKGWSLIEIFDEDGEFVGNV